jgi:hypothetical protein
MIMVNPTIKNETTRETDKNILLRHSYPSECEGGREAGRGRETPNEQRGDYQLYF